jgi:tRNA-specific 2-thiouridylase
VRDRAGAVVGHHDGAAGFTIGQRRGLRLGTPAPDGLPRYVIDVSVVQNSVTVGGEADLLVHRVTAGDPVWLGAAPGPGSRLSAQVRAHGQPVDCVVHSVGAEVTVDLDQPLRAVAPGQTLALYDGSRVVGSGTVEAAFAGAGAGARAGAGGVG